MAAIADQIHLLNVDFYTYYFDESFESFDDFTEEDFLYKLPTTQMFERLTTLCHAVASTVDQPIEEAEVPYRLFHAASLLQNGKIEDAEKAFELIALRVDVLFKEIFLAFIEKEKDSAPSYFTKIIHGNCMENVKRYIDAMYPSQYVLRAHLAQVAPNDKIRDMALEFAKKVREETHKS